MNNLPDPKTLIRPLVEKLHAYTPGEQPKIKGLIKLNTNENPYPPSPKVIEATRAAVDGRLRLYPNATADPLREKLAKLHSCALDNIIVGNGSDELLALAVRAFVDPASGARPKPREIVQYFSPSYSLYPVLADIHGAAKHPVPLAENFGLPDSKSLEKQWIPNAGLTYVTTPNAPSGRGYATEELDALCRAHTGVIILDEAYVNFAKENAMELALKYPHVLVARTFSKAYCLCFQRVGYFVGHSTLIGAMHKVRDSYNVNGLGQTAALATLAALPYYRANFKKVIATRQRLTDALTGLGFLVHPSQTNFIFAKPPGFSAEIWQRKLRENKILVRWFSHPDIQQYLRISIGSDTEADALIAAARQIATSAS
jgi:histidinol-phosphate aminotransferase